MTALWQGKYMMLCCMTPCMVSCMTPCMTSCMTLCIMQCMSAGMTCFIIVTIQQPSFFLLSLSNSVQQFVAAWNHHKQKKLGFRSPLAEAAICQQHSHRNYYLHRDYQAQAHRYAEAEAAAVDQLEEDYVAKCNMANSICPFQTEQQLREFVYAVPVALLSDNEATLVDRLRHAVNKYTEMIGEEP